MPGYAVATAVSLALLAVVWLCRGPVCMQCGGRIRHAHDCYWKRRQQ